MPFQFAFLAPADTCHAPTPAQRGLMSGGRSMVGRAACALAACMAAIALTACGGGTQSKRFVPTKVVSFGDDNSYISATGKKYTINAVAQDVNGNAYVPSSTASAPVTTTDPAAMAYVCGNNPIWVQTVAANYGFDSAQCPVSGASRNAVLLANDPTTTATDASGALVASNVDVAASNAGVSAVAGTISANVGQIDSNTLVLVMAGQADVLQAYKDYLNGGSTAALKQNLIDRLTALASNLANALIPVRDTGARVVLVRVPKLSLSPLGVAAGADNQQVLIDLTTGFNDALTHAVSRGAAQFDGRQLSLVRADDLTNTLVTLASSYALGNVASPGCVTPLVSLTTPLCNNSWATNGTATDSSSGRMVAAGADVGYLWADATHFSPAGHTRLANLVMADIARNPF